VEDCTAGDRVRLRSTVTKFLALSLAERRLFVTSALLLPACAAALHVAGFSRSRDWLARCAQHWRTSLDVHPSRLAAIVNAAAHRLPVPCSCLTRSLALDWMLQHRGVESELRIGVRFVEGRLEAHAWIEVDGRPLNDSADVTDRFAPFEGRVTARLPLVS
jgi:transglutaminase superfamily protein